MNGVADVGNVVVRDSTQCCMRMTMAVVEKSMCVIANRHNLQ